MMVWLDAYVQYTLQNKVTGLIRFLFFWLYQQNHFACSVFIYKWMCLIILLAYSLYFLLEKLVLLHAIYVYNHIYYVILFGLFNTCIYVGFYFVSRRARWCRLFWPFSCILTVVDALLVFPPCAHTFLSRQAELALRISCLKIDFIFSKGGGFGAFNFYLIVCEMMFVLVNLLKWLLLYCCSYFITLINF